MLLSDQRFLTKPTSPAGHEWHVCSRPELSTHICRLRSCRALKGPSRKSTAWPPVPGATPPLGQRRATTRPQTIAPLCDIPSGCCFFMGALDSHPFFPSHVASGLCFLSATAAGAPAGVVSAFAEPCGWCAGAVLDGAGCAVCALAAPSSWRIGVVLVVAGVA